MEDAPNAASLIPASPARPPLAKAEYQAATPEGSAFAELLDVGTEPPRSPRDPISPRAEDVRDAKRPDTGREDNAPTRPKNDPAEEPQDSAKAPPPRQENKIDASTTSKDDADAETSKVIEGSSVLVDKDPL